MGSGISSFGLAAGEAEHHALVAGALFLVLACALVDADGDVLALLIEADEHRAAAAVKALGGIVVPDLDDGIADDLRDIDVAGAGDLAGHEDEPGRDHRLAGYAGVGIDGDHGVEDGVGDLVRDLIRMAHGDGLGRELVGGFLSGGHGGGGLRVGGSSAHDELGVRVVCGSDELRTGGLSARAV
jgi:hypothetical protein